MKENKVLVDAFLRDEMLYDILQAVDKIVRETGTAPKTAYIRHPNISILTPTGKLSFKLVDDMPENQEFILT